MLRLNIGASASSSSAMPPRRKSFAPLVLDLPFLMDTFPYRAMRISGQGSRPDRRQRPESVRPDRCQRPASAYRPAHLAGLMRVRGKWPGDRRALCHQPILHEIPERFQAVASIDLLPFGVRAPVISNFLFV